MSLLRYPIYQDSGIDWIGRIPEGWRIAPLKRLLLEMGSGGTPDTGKAEFWSDDHHGVPWVAIADMSSVEVVMTTSKRLSALGIEDRGLRIWPSGTLLFSMYASLGHVAELAMPAAINQALLALVPNQACDQRYLRYWLESIRPQLRAEASSNTQDNLNAEKVSNLVCLVPSRMEQNAIATFLERETAKIDALIAEQEKLLALLAEKRQATISYAVTRGLNPDAPVKDSGIPWLGPVPEHWEVVRLGALFREVNESGNESLPVLSVSIHDGVSDKELDETELDRKVSRSEDKSKYKSVASGDLVYNMMRAWQGGFGSVVVNGMVSPAYVVARPIRDFLTSQVELVLRTSSAVTEIRRMSRGITDFRLRLYWEDFKVMRVALPPKSEQLEIADYILRVTKKFDLLADEAAKSMMLLQERRSALISAAVTGKIDVRGLVEPKEAA